LSEFCDGSEVPGKISDGERIFDFDGLLFIIIFLYRNIIYIIPINFYLSSSIGNLLTYLRFNLSVVTKN
jgi:hypothetical protein